MKAMHEKCRKSPVFYTLHMYVCFFWSAMGSVWARMEDAFEMSERQLIVHLTNASWLLFCRTNFTSSIVYDTHTHTCAYCDSVTTLDVCDQRPPSSYFAISIFVVVSFQIQFEFSKKKYFYNFKCWFEKRIGAVGGNDLVRYENRKRSTATTNGRIGGPINILFVINSIRRRQHT